jgi:hypothetical protein
MKKVIFAISLAILATCSFYACQKETPLRQAIAQDQNLDSTEASSILPEDSNVEDRSGFCNLHFKVCFRKTPTYSNLPADHAYCYRAFRLMREEIATGTIVQQAPQPAGTWYGLTQPIQSPEGSNHSVTVPNSNGYRYFVEFSAVTNNNTPVVAPYTYVFFSNTTNVFSNPLAFANVSWVYGPGNFTNKLSAKANMSSSCVVTP